jgi:hypothetical protein
MIMADVPHGLVFLMIRCPAGQESGRCCYVKKQMHFFQKTGGFFCCFYNQTWYFLPKKSSLTGGMSLSLRTGITGIANIVK